MKLKYCFNLMHHAISLNLVELHPSLGINIVLNRWKVDDFSK